MTELVDLNWPSEGQDNAGGLRTIGFYAPIGDFVSIPKVPANPVDMSAVAKITTDFNFKTGKGWRKIYSTMDTSEVKSTQVGELDGKSFEHSAEFFHPGNKAEALGFCRLINNGSFIFLFIEPEGNVRVVGSEAFPAKTESIEQTTGKATADRKGTTIMVKGRGLGPAPIYTGVIKHKSAAGAGSGSTVTV